jgi:hypothetical protein
MKILKIVARELDLPVTHLELIMQILFLFTPGRLPAPW